MTQTVDGVADAGGPYTIDEGGDLVLDGTGSLAGAGATFSWDVNDDGTFGDATGATPTLTWAQLEALGITDGTGVPSTITLRLTDGPTFTAVTPLTVDNVAPTATLSNDGPVPEGSTATVTFTGQADPSADDLAALVYSYDFDNDGTFEVTSSASASATVPASFLADGPGTRTVRAVVADDDGGSLELTTDIAITNAAATATITGPSTATVGVPVTLKVGADDPSPGDMAGTFSFTVDWGDGSPAVTLTGPADPPVTHTYTAAGTFTVTATVTDPDGSTSEPLTFTITVIEQVTPSSTTTTAPTTTAPSSTARARRRHRAPLRNQVRRRRPPLRRRRSDHDDPRRLKPAAHRRRDDERLARRPGAARRRRSRSRCGAQGRGICNESRGLKSNRLSGWALTSLSRPPPRHGYHRGVTLMEPLLGMIQLFGYDWAPRGGRAATANCCRSRRTLPCSHCSGRPTEATVGRRSPCPTSVAGHRSTMAMDLACRHGVSARSVARSR